jgi:hypothetical protein
MAYLILASKKECDPMYPVVTREICFVYFSQSGRTSEKWSTYITVREIMQWVDPIVLSRSETSELMNVNPTLHRGASQVLHFSSL